MYLFKDTDAYHNNLNMKLFMYIFLSQVLLTKTLINKCGTQELAGCFCDSQFFDDHFRCLL
ncbi:hypothetical protein NQ317_002734 [Molorchus minor]|uniref:Uncharacterized protein n=1 Tax=Molorchus minor TaxID=1323400 RepID=A0ABQ9K4V6_9CUCU|nr:hypothetical protein NQ317_002734 [Molorchus minor]